MRVYATTFRSIALALCLSLTGTCAAAEPLAPAPPGADAAWRFRVYLDDREIGFHHFYLAERGTTRELRSVADFEYRLAFLKLFDYQHEALETWSGDCLQRMQSHTDSNGEAHAVTGQKQAGVFRVEGSSGTAELPGCVMSFAYWNPAFLQQRWLLNSQNGEYLEVRVSSPVAETLEVRGESLAAMRYHLRAGDLSLDLWYSTDEQWLALESEVRGGRKLRYELM